MPHRLESLGPRPEPIEVGDLLSKTVVTGGRSIFWTGPILTIDDQGNVLSNVVPQTVGSPIQGDDQTTRVEKRYDSSVRLQGSGQFRFDFLIYKLLGIGLSECSDSTLKTLELPPKIVVPFLVMIAVSLLTKPNSKAALDRYYVKMKTPVLGDAEQDAKELEHSFKHPDRFDDRKLWPNSNLEFQVPTRADVIGFVLSLAACFGIIGVAVLVTSIGS